MCQIPRLLIEIEIRKKNISRRFGIPSELRHIVILDILNQLYYSFSLVYPFLLMALLPGETLMPQPVVVLQKKGVHYYTVIWYRFPSFLPSDELDYT